MNEASEPIKLKPKKAPKTKVPKEVKTKTVKVPKTKVPKEPKSKEVKTKVPKEVKTKETKTKTMKKRDLTKMTKKEISILETRKKCIQNYRENQKL